MFSMLCRFGVFSSATHRTVGDARALLEAAVASEAQQQQQQPQPQGGGKQTAGGATSDALEQPPQQQQPGMQAAGGQEGEGGGAAEQPQQQGGGGGGGGEERPAGGAATAAAPALALFEPGLILHRDHTEPAGPERTQVRALDCLSHNMCAAWRLIRRRDPTEPAGPERTQVCDRVATRTCLGASAGPERTHHVPLRPAPFLASKHGQPRCVVVAAACSLPRGRRPLA